jgi:predicted O-methyltransferase YrrM
LALLPLLDSLTTLLLRRIFQRYIRKRLPDLAYPEHIIALDYSMDPKPRYGHGHPAHEGLYRIVAKNRSRYQSFIADLQTFENEIRSIARLHGQIRAQPTFRNSFFSGVDAIVLYHIIASRKPQRFFEVGSGFSTRFARRAAEDHSPAMQIISCDPDPRSEIDQLCDVVIREPLETVGAKFIDRLQSGDILFVDSSHRCYANSDVCVLFLEILPALPPGAVVHFHDIFLPYDYPMTWMGRHYTEQYLLACWLLANPGRFECIFPGAFVWGEADLRRGMEQLWADEEMQKIYRHMEKIYLGYGSFSFWFEIEEH